MVFRATDTQKIGETTFRKGQPVLYIDSAKTSTLEGAATTVYAQGGRGNTRLITWEGEKTLTFTVEDALLSPLGFSILSGAGLFKKNGKYAHVHHTVKATVREESSKFSIDIGESLLYLDSNGNTKINYVDADAPLFISKLVDDSVVGMVDVAAGTGNTEVVAASTLTGSDIKDAQNLNVISASVSNEVGTCTIYLQDRTDAYGAKTDGFALADGDTVMVDCYIVKPEATAMELQIDAEHFAGYYYVEADTLVRKKSTGKDCPAIITLPKVKIQSNFSIAMASSGDPSTFTFTMDAMPGYTYFDRTKEFLCVFQIIDESGVGTSTRAVMRHDNDHSHGHEKMDPEDNGTVSESNPNPVGHDSYFTE